MTASGRWLPMNALGFVVVLAATIGTASADILVLDVCMQKCTDDDWRAIDNIRLAFQSELHNSAILASVDEMVYRLGNSVPFPGIDDPNLTAKQLTKELEDGIGLWTAGDHEAAADRLQEAITKALVNPALVVSDANLRRVVLRAYIGRSVSLYRLKRTKDPKLEPKDPRVIEAREAIGDIVRMTPDSSIKDTWGSKPDEVFQMSRNELIARGTGTLSIQINDPAAVFYLHPAGQPHQGTFIGEVFSGRYHIFVTDALNRYRRYEVDVAPHQHTVLNIDWRRDTKMEARESRPDRRGVRRARIGFTFASFAERRREADYASDIGTQVPGSLVVVVGRIKWEGKEALIGAIYAPEQPASRVGVALGSDLSAARDLGFFLLTDKTPQHIIQLAAPPWEVPLPSRGEDGLSSEAKWLIIGIGCMAIAGGATLYALDHPPDRNTAPYGIGFGAVGIATVGLGFWFGRAPSTVPVVSLSASHATIGWAGRF